jgi:hypothetical protein
MFQKRSLTGFLVASLGLAAGLAVFASADLASADDCGAYKHAEVQKVCKDKGGKKGVEAAMKDAVKAANKAGSKLACKDCHDTAKGNALKSDAGDKFDKELKQHFGK